MQGELPLIVQIIVVTIVQMKINPNVLHEIQHLSAYKKFEIETCQLQVGVPFERLIISADTWN